MPRSKKHPLLPENRQAGGGGGGTTVIYPGGHGTRRGTSLDVPINIQEICDVTLTRKICDAKTYTKFRTITEKCNSFLFNWGGAFDHMRRDLKAVPNFVIMLYHKSVLGYLDLMKLFL